MSELRHIRALLLILVVLAIGAAGVVGFNAYQDGKQQTRDGQDYGCQVAPGPGC